MHQPLNCTPGIHPEPDATEYIITDRRADPRKSYALQGDAYTISFYLGLDSEMGVLPPGGMPSSHPNYIGSVNTFSFRAVGENGTVICNNCTTQQGQGALSTAQIVLTVPLFLITTGQCPSAANTDGLRDMQPDSVEAYLAEHLQWRAVSVCFHV